MERKIQPAILGAGKAAPSLRVHPHISFAIHAVMVLVVVIAATMVLVSAENYFGGGRGLSAIEAETGLANAAIFEQQNLSP